MTSWLKAKFHRIRVAKLGRIRISTVALIAAFCVLFWVHQTFQPQPTADEAPVPAVVPPGYVPDPNYTWVPRTNVLPRESEFPTPTTTTTTPTTSPTEPTTSPGEATTSDPDTPTSPSPATTVLDPDGSGPLGSQTFTQAPPSTSGPTTGSAVPVAPTTAPTR